MVGMIMIAEKDGGVSSMPSQKAAPSAPMIEKMMMAKAESVPDQRLTQRKSTIMNSASITGNKYFMSLWVASGNAWFIIEMPVSLISYPG